ncbi:MAG: PilZ domain-containing protein [Desulfovibrionaceae bacterium]
MEHRRRTRVSGEFEGELAVAGARIPVTTINVSLKGALCQHAQNSAAVPMVAKGAPCVLTITLARDVAIILEGALVRLDASEAAIDFTGMDEESYAHLRNMVRYMAPDPDVIDAEQTLMPFADA